MKDNTHANDQVYLRVRKAKSDVETFLRDYGPINSIADFMLDVCNSVGPDGRLVLGGGMFSYDEGNQLVFMMPPTSKVIRYMAKSKDRFDRGYVKITILGDSLESEEGVIKTTLTRYEIKPEAVEKIDKFDLHAVLDVILPNDDAYCDKVVSNLEDLFAESATVAIADAEEVLGVKLSNEDGLDHNAYGWKICPVINIRPGKNGNVLSLPPCEKI